LYTLFGVCFSNVQAELSPQQLLGRFLYFDENLSEPAGQSCASCHHPDAGFADPDANLPVSEGVISGRFGSRNSPSTAYAVFFPKFSYIANIAIGGQFWDGRTANLTEQAKGPFLNPVEMNNPNKATVIADIQTSSYVDLFEEVCGSIADIDAAYDCMAEAIAAFEGSDELNKFTSKFDFVMTKRAIFTPQEQLGRMLFNGQALCNQCHVGDGMMMGGGGMGSMGGMGGPLGLALFTDFRYHNLGLPKNTEYPLDQQPSGMIDLGLGGVLGVATENGKFKTPHLRNVALTPPYMHNGLLKTLKEVVHFYNTRDIPGLWNPPEVPENVELGLLGNLGLTSSEEDAIVAFMLTFTDDYVP
jgi:cytochrome c peroxidase